MPNGHEGPDPEINGRLKTIRMRLEWKLQNTDDEMRTSLIQKMIDGLSEVISLRTRERNLPDADPQTDE